MKYIYLIFFSPIFFSLLRENPERKEGKNNIIYIYIYIYNNDNKSMADQEEMCRGELAPPLRLDNDRGVVTEGGWGRGGVAGVGRFL